MEYALEENYKNRWNNHHHRVLILVLMEYALEETDMNHIGSHIICGLS